MMLSSGAAFPIWTIVAGGGAVQTGRSSAEADGLPASGPGPNTARQKFSLGCIARINLAQGTPGHQIMRPTALIEGPIAFPVS